MNGSTSKENYVLPPLPYGYDALEPVIDAETMKLHHDKHHRAYVDKLNAALEKYPQWLGLPIDDLLRRLHELPEDIRQAVHDQGGGHANHALFWNVLMPKSAGKPDGELAKAIIRDFGSFDDFKKKFEEAGTKQFGSGWVFLVTNPKDQNRLEIVPLPNQETPVEHGLYGLMLCDVWEHAYYLKYNNRRPDWLKKFWDIVNWDYVAKRFADSHSRSAA